MKTRRVISIAAALLLVSPAVQAQSDTFSVSARAGMIRTLWTQMGETSVPLWAFYPEIRIGGILFVPYLSWGASWGYWSDGVEQALPVMDRITYSQSSHVVAVRIGFHPRILDSRVPIPISVFAGAAEHFIRYEYVGGNSLTGEGGRNSTDQSFTAFVGAGLSFPVLSYLKLEAEAQQFIPFGGGEMNQAYKNRRVFTIGFSVSF
jgi:hypothetical protein